MTFQEILDGIARNRANPPGESDVRVSVEFVRKINEIEWALYALAEALRDREQEFKAVRNELDAAFVAMKGCSEKEESGLTQEQLAEAARRLSHGNDVDDAFDEFEKRNG